MGNGEEFGDLAKGKGLMGTEVIDNVQLYYVYTSTWLVNCSLLLLTVTAMR